MLRFRSSSIPLACLIVILLGSSVSAVQRIPVDGQSSIRLIEQTEDLMTFEVQVGEIVAMDVATTAGDFSRLFIPGFHHSLDVGDPALPMMKRLFEIPYGASVEIEVGSYETRKFRLADFGIEHLIMPAQPSVPKNVDPSTLVFHVNSEAYEPGRVVERRLVAVEDIGQLRAVRGGRVEVSPVSYNPGDGTITVRHNIRFTLHFRGADHERGMNLKASTNSPFFDLVYSRFEGYRGVHDSYPDLMQGPVTYVIVSDRSFETLLQPFIAWKKEQGFQVIEAYTDMPEVGSSTNSIRNYLHGLYEDGTPDNPSPTFVLFVGDVNLIPCFQSSGPTDNMYCDVTGDYIPEMYYGRFSARNTGELAPQIEKTLEFEQCTMPDPSYLAEVVLIAGVDGNFAWNYGNGQINYGTNHYFNEAHGIQGHIYLYPESGSSGPQIRQDVSDGVAFVNYTAHGSSGGWANPAFNNGHIDDLQNEHMYCLAIGNCCDTSIFSVGDCFAEHWLRADRKGAIGYIGGANSTYWDEDYWWAVGAGPVIASGATYEQTGLGTYDGIWHDHGEAMDQWYVIQDAMIFCGNLAVVEGGGMSTYYWKIYNLMGDPSLSPYLGVPAVNSVAHDPTISPEVPQTQTCHVEAEPNSYVGLTKDGNLIGCALIGPSGSADIPIEGHGSSGSVKIVVTCQNKIPYIADVPVSGSSSAHDAPITLVTGVRNGPNPFGERTRVLLTLSRSEKVSLRIFDLNGRLVRTLTEGTLTEGEHFYNWDGRDGAGRIVSGGVYLARLNAGNNIRTWKMVLSQ
jgi:hypothetical protein